MLGIDAVGCTKLVPFTHGMDPFTGIRTHRVTRRSSLLHHENDERRRILRRALLNGAAWEARPEDLIATVSKKKKFEKKRLGTKAVKAAERLSDASGNLDAESATMYRALSARVNYLANDKPDIAFTAKELCRDFWKPTAKSVEKLKMCVRYLCHKPRLVYNYPFHDPASQLTTYVDIDFAGDVETRRSTSCGAIFRENYLLDQYYQTQTTIAFSSAEAELSGIDHMRTADFSLTNIERAKNPAGILTKFVDRAFLDKKIGPPWAGAFEMKARQRTED